MSEYPTDATAEVLVLRPGVVLIRGAVSLATQLQLLTDVCEVGHTRRRWWKQERDQPWELTGERQVHACNALLCAYTRTHCVLGRGAGGYTTPCEAMSTQMGSRSCAWT